MKLEVRTAVKFGLLQSRWMWRVAILWMLCGCLPTRKNPAFCDSTADCEVGLVCDAAIHTCTEVECISNDECSEVTMPICGPDDVCRACVADEECSTQVCMPDGSCAPDAAVLYVRPGGATSGQCESTARCDLSYARSLIDESRFIVQLSDGTYVLSTAFAVDASFPKVFLAGTANAVLESSNSNFVLDVRTGASLNVRGLTLNDAIACVGATLEVDGISLRDGAPDPHPWLQLVACTTTITKSLLLGATAQGVVATNGTTLLRDTRVLNSAGTGIEAAGGGTIEVSRVIVSDGAALGIDTNGTTLRLSRSTVSSNHAGGVRCLDGVFDVTNNFIFANGNDTDAEFGGARLETGLPGSRVEHNTIVFNDSNVAQNPPYAGGLHCISATAFNNLIDGNFAGNQTQSNAQFNGNCATVGSLISHGEVDMHYVELGSVSGGGDYHLADAASPAVNVGTIGSLVDDDVDGQPRSDGSPDVGADEFVP